VATEPRLRLVISTALGYMEDVLVDLMLVLT